MSQGDPYYLDLLAHMESLHRAKAAGYSGDNPDTWANFREAALWGVAPKLGVLVRMGDKYRRLQNVVANPTNEQLGETDIDTALDLAAYALIYVCLRREELDGAVRPSSTTSNPQGPRRKG
jgi:hypothetical protein